MTVVFEKDDGCLWKKRQESLKKKIRVIEKDDSYPYKTGCAINSAKIRE